METNDLVVTNVSESYFAICSIRLFFKNKFIIHYRRVFEKPVTVRWKLPEKWGFEWIKILIAYSASQNLSYLYPLIQFPGKCLSCNSKRGKQPLSRQLLQGLHQGVQALCQMEKISTWRFPGSKQWLLGRKSISDHLGWRFLLRRDVEAVACHKGNLQTKELIELCSEVIIHSPALSHAVSIGSRQVSEHFFNYSFLTMEFTDWIH